MKIAHLEPFCGAAGDMLLGACVDCGVGVKDLEKALRGLKLPGWRLEARPVMKGPIGATKVDVVIGKGKSAVTEFETFEHGHAGGRVRGYAGGREGGHHHHGHAHGMALPEILELLKRAKLPATVKEKATTAFLTLGRAEARVHRKTLKSVHFHEVGAVDSIVDMTGGILALEMLGVERVTSAPLPVSHGHIHCAHGVLPVPGPATLEIIKGAPTAPLDVDGETLTPTGAALIRTLASSYGPQPAMRVTTIGYGAGDRDFPERPNVLRLVVGDAAADGDADEVFVVETNLDNVTPEVVGYALEKCFEAGAVDAFATAIQMKKGRPATLVTALVPPAALAAVEDALFRETGTLGVRRHLAARTKLARDFVAVSTRYGTIRVKTGARGGKQVTASPEFEDCRRAAEKAGVPLRTVMAEVVRRLMG
ncbi:MAG: nickel pincer cofactor biosynthesis protein LarC [Planctomycetia bacterium]|nr:nickel pincer cofactor biosynthesis protein LarC [Planctomycetia bacterium]